MNIYANEGDKIVFVNPNNGYNSDIERAKKHLELGKKYTVSYTDIGSWSTDVYIKEIPNIPFNSVMFEDSE